MIVTLKAIYVNDKGQDGKSFIDKNGAPYWQVVLDTEEKGKLSKIFSNPDMIPHLKEGDKFNVDITTNGIWKNWEFPKVPRGETPYSIQPENPPAPMAPEPEPYEGAYNTSQKHNPVAPKANYVPKPKEDKPDWDAIAAGKVRHGVSIAFVERGIALTEDTKIQINQWTEFIITGK